MNTKNIKRIFEKVCKMGQKHGGEHCRKSSVYNGRQIVIDGVRLFSITDRVELAPEYTATEKDDVKLFGEIYAEQQYKMYNHFVGLTRKKAKTALTAPDAKTLKEYIKANRQKRSERVVYDFGDGFPLVNAEYLLDALTIYGDDAKLYAGGLTDGIYIKSERGDGVIMPIRKDYYYATKTA